MESSTPGINESLRNAKLLLKKSKRVDYYKLLEISQDANDYDIKKVCFERCQYPALSVAYCVSVITCPAERWPNGITELLLTCSPECRL